MIAASQILGPQFYDVKWLNEDYVDHWHLRFYKSWNQIAAQPTYAASQDHLCLKPKVAVTPASQQRVCAQWWVELFNLCDLHSEFIFIILLPL